MKIPYPFTAFLRSVFVLFCIIYLPTANAQCNNWAITATLINGSTCAANGSFRVAISGPDAANLTNIQYGVPLAANGFSVPLNNSQTFSGIPPGTYQVSAVAICGGVSVGKNATIVIPGSYAAPLARFTTRPSLSCATTGNIVASIDNGVAPFNITIISSPPGYTGQRVFTSSAPYYIIPNLPAGSYSMQVIDACNTGTSFISTVVGSLSPANIPMVPRPLSGASCDSIWLPLPYINGNQTVWSTYQNDTSFKVSAQVSGGIANATPFQALNGISMPIRLPAGKTVKDAYGQTIIWTIKPPCGPNTIITQIINAVVPEAGYTQHCNVDLDLILNFNGPVCLPITYSFVNYATGAINGPYTTSTFPVFHSGLPVSSYTINYTTADGYSGSSSVGAGPVPGIPYRVSIVNGSNGYNNYIEGFNFESLSPGNGGSYRSVELFNGPAGYSYSGQWSFSTYRVYENGTPTPSTLKFPAGNYVWKITDDCGVYYLPITVGPEHLYQFTVGAPLLQQTCQGLQVTPTGTGTHLGQNAPVNFAVLKDGEPMWIPFNGYSTWPAYPQGTPILLTSPGVYTILPTTYLNGNTLANYYPNGNFTLGYPNQYMSSYTFTYTLNPAAVDINQTQGFMCPGGSAGQGQLYAKGTGGIQFQTAPNPHYKYYLAQAGNGVTGPYIANNNTGIFTGFGGNANAFYDLKVIDSCGAFAVQKIRILDLGTARLIASSKYVACNMGTVTLSAIYLPGATYSWTGPNGFTSSLRAPVITNAGPQHTGVYRVSINSPTCGATVRDSTILVLNQNPPKPLVSITCGVDSVFLTITNPTAGLKYPWDLNFLLYGDTLSVRRPPTPNNTQTIYLQGFYNAVALDTSTGCFSLSDTVLFSTNPNLPFVATVYAPHLRLCPGDTTTLVATDSSQSYDRGQLYQWFRNGAMILGATQKTYITNVPGNYKVRIEAGPCSMDTSLEVTVSNTPFPSATIHAPKLAICAGDTAFIMANANPDYSYTWHVNGTSIPGAPGATLGATVPGHYYVTVSNGGCIANSDSLYLRVDAAPSLSLSPNTQQDLCPGDTVHFSATPDAQYTYKWLRNGVPIANAVANTYLTDVPGSYMVRVSTALCPNVTAGPVIVRALPHQVTLGNDTVICNAGPFAITLKVDASFPDILWSDGQKTPTIRAAAPGLYWVRATNKCGIFTDSLRIRTIDQYMPQLPDDTLICNAAGTTLLQVPSLLQNIRWSTGEGTATVYINQPGRYWVTGTSPCGAMSDTVSIRFCPPVIQSIGHTDTLCEGDCVQHAALVDQYPQTYQWILPGAQPDTAFTVAPRACYPHAGTYPVTLIVTNPGGSDTMTSLVIVASKPVPRFKDTTIVLAYKKTVTLPACANATVVAWYKDDSLICSNCPTLTVEGRQFRAVYHCVVSNGGCADSCDYKLQIIDIPHDLWLPDAFTPNGDGRNDYFRTITDNPNVYGIDLSIYNRYGQKIHISHGSNDGWDGRVNGQEADAGTYFWMLRYKVLGTDESFFKKGDLILVR